MANRLYTGLVHKQLRGNREDALTLKREARTKVGYLFDAMRPGETFKTGSWSLGDGRRIMAFVWNDVLGKRAIVRLTGIGSEITRAIIKSMDHGLLAWESLDETYYCYVTLEIADYYTAGGLAKASCSTAVVPELDERNRHESLVERTTTTNLEDATNYTGLTRLFIQALHGAGRSWAADFAPTLGSLGANGETLGCVRSPDGVYWLIFIAASLGVQAVRLEPAEDMSCLVTAVNAGELTGEDIKFADALILGYSTIDGDVIELLPPDEAAWLGVYADGFEPLVWNWSWRYQHRGEIDEDTSGACICTHKLTPITEIMPWDTWTLQYRESVMDITFDMDGTPLVAITETRSGYSQYLGDHGTHVAVLDAYRITAKFLSNSIVPPAEETPELCVLATVYLPTGEISSVEIRGTQIYTDKPAVPNTCIPGVSATITNPVGVQGWEYPTPFIFGNDPLAFGITNGSNFGGTGTASANIEADGYDFSASNGGVSWTRQSSVMYFAKYAPGIVWVYGKDGKDETTSSFSVSAFIPGAFGFGCDELLFVAENGCGFEPLYPDGCDPAASTTYAPFALWTIINGAMTITPSGEYDCDYIFAEIVADTVFDHLDNTTGSNRAARDTLSFHELALVTGADVPVGLDSVIAASPYGGYGVVSWVGAS